MCPDSFVSLFFMDFVFPGSSFAMLTVEQIPFLLGNISVLSELDGLVSQCYQLNGLICLNVIN